MQYYFWDVCLLYFLMFKIYFPIDNHCKRWNVFFDLPKITCIFWTLLRVICHKSACIWYVRVLDRRDPSILIAYGEEIRCNFKYDRHNYFLGCNLYIFVTQKGLSFQFRKLEVFRCEERLTYRINSESRIQICSVQTPELHSFESKANKGFFWKCFQVYGKNLVQV